MNWKAVSLVVTFLLLAGLLGHGCASCSQNERPIDKAGIDGRAGQTDQDMDQQRDKDGPSR